MKREKIKKMLCISLLILLVITGFCSELFGNIGFLIAGRGYFIPKESSVFTFKATRMNEGSGEWWLYGEDRNYYYALNTEPDYKPGYFKLEKDKISSSFDKHNYHTWNIE